MNRPIEQLSGSPLEQITKKISSEITTRRSLIARTSLALVLQAAGCTSFGEGVIIPEEENDAGADTGPDSGDASITIESGVDAGKDVAPEAEAGDAADAGPVYGFENDPKKNVCIKWMTLLGGVKQNASPDDNNCDPKPYGALPLAPSLDLGVWSKDAPTNNAIGFKSPYNITTYNTRCSPSPTPPNNAQLESLMKGGGYVGTTNASTLPDVDLANASCANGAMYVMHIAP